MFQRSRALSAFTCVFCFLFASPPAQACLGADLEDTLFFNANDQPLFVDRISQKPSKAQGLVDLPPEAEVIAEVILTGPETARIRKPDAANIVRVIKTSDPRVRPGEKIPIKYALTSCGPNHINGDEGTIAAQIGVDIDDRLVLCPYSRRFSDGHISSPHDLKSIGECNPGAIEAARQIKRAAENGDAQAQRSLARMYEVGANARVSDDEALKWFKRAAENGNTEAMSDLGEIYTHGLLGVEQDATAAIKWLTRAVKKGDSKAKPNLEKLKEVEALKLAAAKGEAEAQYELGRIFFIRNYNLRLDDGRRKEYSAEAIKNFELAAAQGEARAMCELGDMYFGHGYSTGIAKDNAEAVKWYRLGAEKGDARSQFKLGGMYQYGRGVAENPAEAMQWYHLAAEQGYGDARSALKRMGK